MIEDDADGIEEGDVNELVKQPGVVDNGGEHGVLGMMWAGFLRGIIDTLWVFICGYRIRFRE